MLSDDLAQVDPEFQRRVHRSGGLSDQELLSLVSGAPSCPATRYDQATRADVREDFTIVEVERGERAMQAGEVAFCILAGGMGTRLGAPKALARIPDVGLSLLAWKLMQAGGMPTWIMASPSMIDPIQQHLATLALPPGTVGCVFPQFEGYRLTPDNKVAFLYSGIPDLHPLGHGDVGPALVENGVLDDNPKVRYVVVCNVDNVLCSPHPAVIGRHIKSDAAVTCEVVERREGDAGGVLAWVNDHLEVVEDFRLPVGFADAAAFQSTNTMVFNVEALQRPIPWRWHRVRKCLGPRIVVQHERLLQQYTEECQTDFVLVPRDTRYSPVKTADDLKRAGELLKTFRFWGG